MAHLVLGYDFECKEFTFQGRPVKGLLFEVAKGIKVEPYKSYVLVPYLSFSENILTK